MVEGQPTVPFNYSQVNEKGLVVDERNRRLGRLGKRRCHLLRCIMMGEK